MSDLDKTCDRCRHWNSWSADGESLGGDCDLQLPPWLYRALVNVTQGERGVSLRVYPGETCGFWSGPS